MGLPISTRSLALRHWRPRPLSGITLASLVGAVTYFVHLSASASVQAVSHARQLGQPVHAETCPHYLFLTKEEYDRPDFEAARFVMTPPLRTRGDQDALWTGLRTGDLSVVSTDHCPFCMSEQPYGMLFSKQQGRDDFSRIQQYVVAASSTYCSLQVFGDDLDRALHVALDDEVEVLHAGVLDLLRESLQRDARARPTAPRAPSSCGTAQCPWPCRGRDDEEGVARVGHPFQAENRNRRRMPASTIGWPRSLNMARILPKVLPTM